MEIATFTPLSEISSRIRAVKNHQVPHNILMNTTTNKRQQIIRAKRKEFLTQHALKHAYKQTYSTRRLFQLTNTNTSTGEFSPSQTSSGPIPKALSSPISKYTNLPTLNQEAAPQSTASEVPDETNSSISSNTASTPSPTPVQFRTIQNTPQLNQHRSQSPIPKTNRESQAPQKRKVHPSLPSTFLVSSGNFVFSIHFSNILLSPDFSRPDTLLLPSAGKQSTSVDTVPSKKPTERK